MESRIWCVTCILDVIRRSATKRIDSYSLSTSSGDDTEEISGVGLAVRTLLREGGMRS